VYREQVIVNKKVNLSGRPMNGQTAIIRPSVLAETRDSMLSGNPVAAAMFIDGTFADVESFDIDLSLNTIQGCTPKLVGVYARNATGSLRSVSVSSVRVPAQPTCDTGVGVFVESGSTTQSHLIVTDPFFFGFQKGAIVASGPNTMVNVLRAIAQGDGPIASPVQNGIQISTGATGRVRGSVLSRLATTDPTKRATGVLLYLSNRSLVSSDTVLESQTAFFSVGNKNRLKAGKFTSFTDEGVIIFGDGNRVRKTSVSASGGAAFFVDGNFNTLFGGSVTNAPIGVWFLAGEKNRQRSNAFQTVADAVLDGGTTTLDPTAASPFTTLCQGDSDCNDGDPCTTDTCNVVSGGCTHTASPDGTACDDKNTCTTGDTCVAGQCTGTPVADGTLCDDGSFCTVNDVCTGGVCGGAAQNCDDGNACTLDSCDALHSVCVHAILPGCAACTTAADCNDNNACTDDACTAGSCTYSGTNCDDANPCTTDSCIPTTGCAHANVPDGTACGTAMTCTAGVCG
jgi:hypothetical protein